MLHVEFAVFVRTNLMFRQLAKLWLRNVLRVHSTRATLVFLESNAEKLSLTIRLKILHPTTFNLEPFIRSFIQKFNVSS